MHDSKIQQSIIDEYKPNKKTFSDYVNENYPDLTCEICNASIEPPSMALWYDAGAIHSNCIGDTVK